MNPDTIAVDIDQTYQTYKNLIYKSIHTFLKTHGGDFDELLSICHEAFMEAVRTHQESQSSLGTWLWNMTQWKMLSLLNQKQPPTIPIDHCAHKIPCRKDTAAEWADFLEGLSDDAKYITAAALDTPFEVLEAARAKGRRPISVRLTIRAACKAAGWQHKRIRNAFAEIRKALRG